MNQSFSSSRRKEKLFSFVDISEQASRVSLSTVMPSMSEPKLLCEVAFANGNTIKLSTAVTPENFKVLVRLLKANSHSKLRIELIKVTSNNLKFTIKHSF